MDGMWIGVKVEKPENYDGAKERNLDIWLLWVREHLDLIVIPKRGHVPYATSFLQGNATLWWCELCEGNRGPVTWDDFYRVLHEYFRIENYSCHSRDKMAMIHQFSRESIADFVFHFCAICLKILDLSELERLDRFVRALAPEIRL